MCESGSCSLFVFVVVTKEVITTANSKQESARYSVRYLLPPIENIRYRPTRIKFSHFSQERIAIFNWCNRLFRSKLYQIVKSSSPGTMALLTQFVQCLIVLWCVCVCVCYTGTGCVSILSKLASKRSFLEIESIFFFIFNLKSARCCYISSWLCPKKTPRMSGICHHNFPFIQSEKHIKFFLTTNTR